MGIGSPEGSRRLDRQEHDAITKGTAQKPVALIKANCIVIDSIVLRMQSLGSKN